MPPKTNGKSRGKNGEAVQGKAAASSNGMTWMGLAGLGLLAILLLSVIMQRDDVQANGAEDEEKVPETAPRKMSELKTTTAQPEEEEEPAMTTPAKPKEPTPAKPKEPTPAKPKEQKEPPKRKKPPKVNPFELHVPRMTLAELHKNETLRSGHHAFVVTDVVSSWKATNWTLKYLKEKIPFEWVDYYPENMKDQGNKPFLVSLEKAVPDFKMKSPHSKYMQMRISLRGWKRIRKDLDPMPDHPTFWDDDTWIRQCMKKPDGKPDEKAIDNFFRTNQWKFLLIGQKDTSMFFHKDHLAATSWQAQIKGRKRWTLCPVSETKYLNYDIDTYNPDYKKFPNFAKALCGQVTVHPGEMVYYPAYMWHHAYQLDTPTISYTSLLVGTEADRDDLGGMDKKVHTQFYRDLMHKCQTCWTRGKKDRHCDDISIRWPGAAPPPNRDVCDKYLPKCLKLWDNHSNSLWSRVHVDDEAADLGEFD